jgi:hypothetical protein
MPSAPDLGAAADVNAPNGCVVDALYRHYADLHDHFADGEAMHALRRLRGESPSGDSLASALREHRGAAL